MTSFTRTIDDELDPFQALDGALDTWVVAKAAQAGSAIEVAAPENVRWFELQAMRLDYTATAMGVTREITVTVKDAAGSVIWSTNTNQAVTNILAGATVVAYFADRTSIAGVDGGPGTDYLPALKIGAGWTLTVEDRNDVDAADTAGLTVSGWCLGRAS